ncbi:DUF4332 domain-containing protein [Candidatus Bathyarchaeota archaeon]|nr:DUF4332 domain-containing protein [Candidatus Bathyarchaeota archaeon]
MINMTSNYISRISHYLRYVTVKGKAIWILAFCSFLSGLNAVNAIFLSVTLGIEDTFQPILIGSLIGSIPVYVYLILSVFVTFLFLGATYVSLVTELSNKELLNEINAKVATIENGQKLQQKVLESLQARVFLVDESVNSMRKEVARAFAKQEEDLKQVQANLTKNQSNLAKKIDSDLDAVKGEMSEQMNKQSEEIEKTNTNLANLFSENLAEVKDELAGQLVRLAGTLESQERRARKSEKAILNQEKEIAEIKTKIERVEDEFVPPKPLLTSQCKVEDVRGIGENTGNELREIGIADVGEFVLTDSNVIADKIDMSEKTVEKLQGRAQLAMIPGLKEKDLVLLEEAEVMNRKELASQDPIELGKKINGIARIQFQEKKISEAEIPTIEEVYAWIKAAKA